MSLNIQLEAGGDYLTAGDVFELIKLLNEVPNGRLGVTHCISWLRQELSRKMSIIDIEVPGSIEYSDGTGRYRHVGASTDRASYLTLEHVNTVLGKYLVVDRKEYRK